jgi:hypothetical protein
MLLNTLVYRYERRSVQALIFYVTNRQIITVA